MLAYFQTALSNEFALLSPYVITRICLMFALILHY